MKILFITDLIPIDDNENCAKALVPIIKELSLKNVVDIVRPNFLFNSKIRGKMIKPNGTYECNGIKIKNINFFSPFWFTYFDINLEDYDEIIAHMPSGILFAERLLKNFKGTPPKIIYAVHQSDIQVMRSPLYAFHFRKVIKTAYNHADKIICRSPHLKAKLLKLLPALEEKTEVKISKIPPKYWISDELMFSKIKAYDGLKFITAANLIKRKNIDLLLNAFADFKAHDFSLEIIGDGPEMNSLKRLCKFLGLENKVFFLGKLPHDKVIEHLKEANIFILPSINETLGLAYLEASACGCLCIGTKNTGIDGVFQDNINCFLCEPDIEGVSKVLSKVFKLTSDDFKNLLKNRSLADIL